MFEYIIEISKNAAYLFGAVINGLERAGFNSAIFFRDTFRAHFNLVARYTAPIEQELFDTKPPSVKNLNIFGQIALTLVPLTILSWIVALTIAPLIYNSALFLRQGFIRTTNLALFDLLEKQLNLPKVNMPWYRQIFGIPGLILGNSLGLVIASIISFIRVVINSTESFIDTFVAAINCALEPEEQMEVPESKYRPRYMKYGFRLPGVILGGIAGTIGFIITGLGRVFFNSFVTAKSMTVSALNAVRHEEDQIEGALNHDMRRNFLKYGLGFPGLIFGGFSAGIGISFAAAERSTIESWQTTKRLFIDIASKALPAKDLETEAVLDPQLAIEQRSYLDRYVFGAPGVVFGVPLGSMAFMAVGLGRIFGNSLVTIKSLTVSGVNLVRHEEEQIEWALAQDTRPAFLKYGLGFPGLFLGSGTAVVGIAFAGLERSIFASWEVGQQIFFDMVKQALPTPKTVESAQLNSLENVKRRSNLDRYVFGVPGILFGVISGSIGFSGVIVGRVVANSFDSAWYRFVSITNLALDLEDHIGLENDGRPKVQKFGFGLPGFILGVIAGSLGFVAVGMARIILNSLITAKSLTVSAMNAVRQEDKQIQWALEHDTRRIFLKYILGFPGLIMGSFSAALGFAAASLQWSNNETWKTTKEIFNTIIKYALPAEEIDEPLRASSSLENTVLRTNFDRYFWGAPGLLLGSLSGGIAFVAVVTVRTLVNSTQSALYSFVLITNFALDPEDQTLLFELQNDQRSVREKYGFGLPGIIFGGIVGSCGFTTMGLGRIFFNSYVTAKSMTVSALNSVRHEKDQIEGTLNHDMRRNFLKYGLGFPGLIFGGFSAGVGISFAVVERSTIESWQTTKRLFIDIASKALPAKDLETETVLDPQLAIKQRSYLDRYVFGAPGIVFGVLLGSMAFMTVGLGRIFGNSLVTMKSLTVSGVNLVRHEEEQIEWALAQDTRSIFRKYGLGFPGLSLGSGTAVVGIAFAGLERSIFASWEVGQQIFFDMVKQALPTPKTVESAQLNSLENVKKRSNLDYYVFGAPGIFVGVILGSLGFSFVGLARIATNSMETVSRMFVSISNLGLNENEKFAYKQFEGEDKRTWQHKYLLGFPGVFIGAFLGAMTLCGIGISKLAIHSFYSWYSLSGSLLNGGFSLPLFSGLVGDKRSDNSKLAGGLGYTLAMVTTLPLALTIFTFKKVVPIFIILMIGSITSPLIAGLKAVKQVFNKPRFDDKNSDEKEQRFKNIYSSLTPWGQFAENGTIKEEQNGRKGPICFARKALTFNISTITEFTLDTLLTAYRESKDHESFFNDNSEFSETIEEIKEHYRALSCLESYHHATARDVQIDNLGTFVRDYVLGKKKSVPEHLYVNPKKSWSAAFWGAEQAISCQQEEPKYIHALGGD